MGGLYIGGQTTIDTNVASSLILKGNNYLKLNLWSTHITKGTAPSSTSYTGIYFTDSTGNTGHPAGRMAIIEHYVGTDKSSNICLRAYGCNAYDQNASCELYARTLADGTTRTGANAAFYGAVWNDYAEFRKDNSEEKEVQQPGRCVCEIGNGTLALTTERLERGCEIISDTFGFAIGQDEENGYNTPIASNGRVLAYPYESIEEFSAHIGWPVCSGPDGTVSIMTEEEEEKYPSRIIGTISEIPTYEIWGTGNVQVNGRIWIRIK